MEGLGVEETGDWEQGSGEDLMEMQPMYTGGDDTEMTDHQQSDYSTADLDLSQVDIGGSSDVIYVDNDTISEVASSQDFPMDEDDSREPLSYELQIGYRILKEIMSDSNKSVNWPFMEAVDVDKLGLYDYFERIQKPMWLKKIEENFDARLYENITDFVSDFRVMLENCYRYNGPDHYVSKRGQKLEMILEQKLALLSRELREKTSIAATSGKPIEEKVISGTRRRKVLVPHDSTALLNQLRMEEKEREKEQRRQQMAEKQKEREAYLAELKEWEDSLYPTPWRSDMNAMWEVPAVGHFLFLCSLQLNIGEVVHWELERGFLLPRESGTFQTVMTSLISTPYQRTRLDKKPMMPYKVWEDKVRVRVRQWYKTLNENKRNMQKTAYKLGIEEMFFKVLGMTSPLERRKFHELTFYQRVWVVKSLCDWCLENQESVREAVEANVIEDQRTYSLGHDAEGYEYIHFPQFCGADLRIYKQAPVEMPKLDTPPREPKKLRDRTRSKRPKKKESKNQDPPKITPPRIRDGRLRQNPKLVQASPNNENSEESSSDASEDSGFSASESEEEPDPKVPRYKRAAVTRNKLLDIDLSDVSREGTPTRGTPVTRSRLGNISATPSRESTPQRLRRSLGDTSASRTSTPEVRRSSRRRGNIDDSLNNETSSQKQSQGDHDEDDDAKSKASEAGSTKSRKRKSGSRANRRSRRKKPKDNSEDEDGDNTMDGSQLQDEESNAEPFSSYLDSSQNEENTIEKAEGKSDTVSGKLSPTSCDTKSTAMDGSECTSERATPFYPDSECSNSVPSTPVSEVLNGHEPKEDHLAGKMDHSKISPIDNGAIASRLDPKDTENCDEKKTNCDDAVETSAISLQVKTENKDDIIKSDETASLCNNTETSNKNRNKDENVNSEDIQMEGNEGKKDSKNCAITSETVDKNVKAEENGIKSEAKSEVADVKIESSKVKTEEEMKTEVEIKSEEGQVKTESSEVKAESSAVKAESSEVKAESSEVKSEDQLTNAEGAKNEQKPKTPEPEPEEEPEIKGPVLGEFQLIVESVEDLRNLVLKFAPPEPIVEVRGGKEKVLQPIPRKKCEVDLYKHLKFLLDELEPWEQKLIAANKRARLKLRKEHATYKEEPEAEEDVWQSEESNSEDSDVENEDNQKNGIVSRKPRPALEVSQDDPKSTDLEVSSRGRIRKRRVIPDAAEEEDDDSPQMRSGKRRRREEDDPTYTQPELATTSSGSTNTTMPSHSTIQSVINQLTATKQLPSNGISVLNINNQMVLVSPGQKPVIIQTSQPLSNINMSNLNLLAQLTGLAKPVPVTGTTTGTSLLTNTTTVTPNATATSLLTNSTGSATATSLLTNTNVQANHPQASPRITITSPTAVRTQVKVQVPVPAVRQVSPRPTNAQSILAALKPGQPITQQQLLALQKQGHIRIQAKPVQAIQTQPLAVTVHPQGTGTNKALTVLPTAAQGTELKKQIITVVSKPDSSASAAASVTPKTSVSKPQYVAYNTLHQMAPEVVQQIVQAQMKSGSTTKVIRKSTTGEVTITSVSSPSIGQNVVSIQPSPQKVQLPNVTHSAQRVLSPGSVQVIQPPVQAPTLVQAVPKVQSPTVIQPNQPMSPVIRPVTPKVFSAASPADGKSLKQANPGLFRALNSPPKPKYAGNVTVKTLLESRAAQQKQSTNGGISGTNLLPQLNAVQSSSVSVTSSEVTASSSPTAAQHPLVTQATDAAASDLERERRLDEAIKTVLTEIQTSLPTATIKVSSPFVTGGGVKPNRSVTVVTSAMKAPIPALPQLYTNAVTTHLQSTESIPSSALSSTSNGGVNTQNIVVKMIQQTADGQKVIVPMQVQPQVTASKVCAMLPSPVKPTPADVVNSQAVASNTALLQQLSAAKPVNIAAPVSNIFSVVTSVPATQSAAAKLQQAANQVKSPTKAALKINSISVQGSSATLQLTGVHGVAPGKAVQLKLTIPPGLTIQQLLMSPQLQQHLANLQTSGLSAAKSIAVSKTVQQGAQQGAPCTQPVTPLQSPVSQPVATRTAQKVISPVLQQKTVHKVVPNQDQAKPVATIHPAAQTTMTPVISQPPQPQVFKAISRGTTEQVSSTSITQNIVQETNSQQDSNTKIVKKAVSNEKAGTNAAQGAAKAQTVQQLLELAQKQKQAGTVQTVNAVSPTVLKNPPAVQISQSPITSPVKIVTQVASKSAITSQPSLTSPSKLVLVNVNGQLMTASASSLSQGILKVVPRMNSPSAMQLPQPVMLSPPQQQVVMVQPQALTSAVKITDQTPTNSLNAAQLLALQQQVQQNQIQVPTQVQVQQNQVQGQTTQIVSVPNTSIKIPSISSQGIKVGVPQGLKSGGVIPGVKVQPQSVQIQGAHTVQQTVKIGGVSGTLVQAAQTQARVTLPSSSPHSPGVAHVRMPVGTVIVPPGAQPRPAQQQNLTAVRLPDGRYVLQVPSSGTASKIILSSSSQLQNGDS